MRDYSLTGAVLHRKDLRIRELTERVAELERLLTEGRNRVAAFVLYEKFDDENLTLKATQRWLHAASAALAENGKP